MTAIRVTRSLPVQAGRIGRTVVHVRRQGLAPHVDLSWERAKPHFISRQAYETWLAQYMPKVHPVGFSTWFKRLFSC